MIRETLVHEDAGIEGILHRLEKYRSLSFGVSMGENGHNIYFSNKVNGGDGDHISADVGESCLNLYGELMIHLEAAISTHLFINVFI